MIRFISIIIFNFLLINTSSALTTDFKMSNYYEGTINIRSEKFNLPKGKWKVMFKERYSISTVTFLCVGFAQEENKIFNGFFEFCEIDTGGRYNGDLAAYLIREYRYGKYDNCTERPEYTIAKLFYQGMSSNCFIVRHLDFNKELYTPDDPADEISRIKYVTWVAKNKIQIPSVVLASSHTYFAPVVKSYALELTYIINPKILGGDVSKFSTEMESEYHPNNIDNYPDKKKIMGKWIEISAKRHYNFEEKLNAKQKHRHDLSQYIDSNFMKKKNTESMFNNNTIDQLKKLKELYDEGVLTKKEFIKAKKKILE